MPQIFQVGESVYAQWPGSALFYKAIVHKFDPIEKTYDVQFDATDDVVTVTKKRVLALSQIETKTRGRSQSPARKKGTGRRARSGSRSRRGRSASPGRSKNLQSAKKLVDKEQSKVQQVVENDVLKEKSENQEAEQRSYSQTVEQISGSQTTHLELKGTVVKSKLTEKVGVESVQYRETTYRRKLRSHAHEIDEEQKSEVVEKKVEEAKPCSWTSWFCYNVGFIWFLAVLLLLLPGLYLVCSSRENCTFQRLPKIPHWDSILELRSIYVAAGWTLFQLLLFFIPVGKLNERQEKNGKIVQARANGIHGIILTLAIAIGLQYTKQGKELSFYLVDKQLSVITANTIISFVLSLLWALFTETAPSKKNEQGSFLSNFILGKRWNPVSGSYDWKLFFLFRVGFLGSVGLIACILANDITSSKKVNLALLFVAVSQLMLLGFYNFVEEHAMTGKDFQNFEVGLFSILGGFVWMPFIFMNQLRYITYFHRSSTQQELVGMGSVIAFGTYLFVVSNYQKMRFRHDQNQLCFKDAGVVVTSDGRNLLCHGWWGRLRHPNYLGDIIMSVGWSLPCGFTHAIPWIYPLYVVVFLLIRAYLDDRDCAKRYGTAWNEYKQRVRYCVLPLIY